MKIVRWADGTYSVRSNFWTYIGHKYADLGDHYWHDINDRCFKNCKGTLEECQNYLNKKTVTEIINNKRIEKLRKHTGELKEELELYAEANELEAKVKELRKKHGL